VSRVRTFLFIFLLTGAFCGIAVNSSKPNRFHTDEQLCSSSSYALHVAIIPRPAFTVSEIK
jgi:hypothetical protein